MKRCIIALIVLLASYANAYRDWETGTFLTRDPLGFSDGPNQYCYVHCNPITHFDALGLYAEATTTENEDGTTETVFEFSAEIVFEDPDLDPTKEGLTEQQISDINTRRAEIVQGIKDGLHETFNGKQGSHSWSTTRTNPETGQKESTLNITVAASASEVAKNNHIIVVTSADRMPGKNPDSGSVPPGLAERGGGMMWLNSSTMEFRDPGHEASHLFGARDTTDLYNENATWQTRDSQSPELNSKVVERLQAYSDYPGALNYGIGPRGSTDRRPADPARIRQLNAADRATKPKERPRVF